MRNARVLETLLLVQNALISTLMQRPLHAKYVNRLIVSNAHLVMAIPTMVDPVRFVNTSHKEIHAKHVLTIFIRQIIASNASKQSLRMSA